MNRNIAQIEGPFNVTVLSMKNGKDIIAARWHKAAERSQSHLKSMSTRDYQSTQHLKSYASLLQDLRLERDMPATQNWSSDVEGQIRPALETLQATSTLFTDSMLPHVLEINAIWSVLFVVIKRNPEHVVNFFSEQEEMFKFEKALFAALNNGGHHIISSSRTQYETSIRWFSHSLDKVARNFLQSHSGRDFHVRRLLELPWPPEPEAVQSLESISKIHTIILEVLLYLNDGSVSLEATCNHLLEKNLVLKSGLETTLYNLVFKMISWITLMYKTENHMLPNARKLVLLDGSNPKSQVVSRRLQCDINEETMSLHLNHLLAHFGNFVPPQFPPQRVQGYSDTMDDSIITTNINYHTLSTIAQIRIEWVDTISLHLEFDEKALALKLFRYPSFCAMHYFRGMSEDTLLSNLFVDSSSQSHHPDSRDSPPYTRSFFLEVLCSYRLIFGQHPKSYKSFEKTSPSPTSDFHDADPLLRQVCGRLCFNNPFYADIGGPRVRTVYSARGDFPNLGRRLLELQDYMNPQNPQDLIALWYDRRDILRFYTFWAVVFVGGLSILLSFIQTVLTAIQVAKM